MNSENENIFVDAHFDSKDFKNSDILKAIQEESKENDWDVMSIEKVFGRSTFTSKNYQISQNNLIICFACYFNPKTHIFYNLGLDMPSSYRQTSNRPLKNSYFA